MNALAKHSTFLTILILMMLTGTAVHFMTRTDGQHEVAEGPMMSPPLELGNTGRITFTIRRVINPGKCFADINFSEGSHTLAIVKLNTMECTIGREIKSSKPFKVSGHEDYETYNSAAQASVSVDTFVLEEKTK